MVSSEDIATFLIMVIIIGLILMFIGFLSNRKLDIVLEKDIFEEHGRAMSLLQSIITSSDIVYKDENYVPMRGVVDLAKIQKLPKNKELDCCSYYDYDYSLEIQDILKKESSMNSKDPFSYYLGYPENLIHDFFNKGKECGMIKSETYSTYSLPISIKDGDFKKPGSIIMRIVKTPLSNIAYSTSIACMKGVYQNEIKVYDIEKININGNEICTETKYGDMCKQIECNIPIKKEYFISDNTNGCYSVKIERSQNEVIIHVPKDF